MIDVAKQEIEECIQKIDNIQYILDNSEDNDDNNTTYERKQEGLKHMQSYELNRIRQLKYEISNLQENDDKCPEPDIHS